ncbi:MinD-like ATPase involved in chromosome partitioning or flagellar assembly [Aurantimicrobium minutum]|uniref:AAA family ATPase n=1 Tax=Aurantimicrobium minutum TaxID=708131 RepID=UPI0024759BE2|nr:P-loop NTPase [Aurantimicrobium minutum]MDH6531806.1 MinD-like ATPase involved in chromosome partitioning or flagellar assembly [Aurantimicrobium minutum]
MTQLVAVWGPTGAPGRTTVAINLAAELAERGHRVLLIDADTYGGTIAPLLGIVDEAAGFAAVCRLAGNGGLSEEELERLSHRVPTGHREMLVLTGIVRSDRWPELSAERIKAALSFLGGSFEFIVADVGFNLETDEEITSDLFAPRRNAATLTVVKAAQRVVQVAGADAVSVARFIRAHSVLLEDFPEAQRIVVLNKVRGALTRLGSADPVASLSRYAGIHHPIEIRWDEKAVASAAHTGIPVRVAGTGSAIAKDFTALAAAIDGERLQASLRSGRFGRSKKSA